jgi:hypothetical protein
VELVLELDHQMLEKVAGYYVYRSKHEGDHPVVDGLYLRREAMDGEPRSEIHLSLEWQ